MVIYMKNSCRKWHRLPSGDVIYLCPNPMNIDEIVRLNIVRLLKSRDLKQNRFAELIDTTPQHMNAIMKGRAGVGSDLLVRMCRVLQIEPWEFYVTEKTPIIKDESEQSAIVRFRQAQVAGVAEDVAKYGEFRIKSAEKEGSSGDIDERLRKGKQTAKEILRRKRKKSA